MTNETYPEDSCQAIVPTAEGPGRVCRRPRTASWETTLPGGLQSFSDLCAEHTLEVELAAEALRLEHWKRDRSAAVRA